MKRLAIIFLLAFCGNAFAQSTVRYPEYQPVWERETICRDVVVENGPNVTGAVVGAVVGYAIGRELDRGHRGYYGHNHGRYYRDRHYGRYYRDNYHHGHYRYNSRGGRIGGTVVGGVIGSQVGRGHTIRRVCEQGPHFSQYREEIIGYRVITTYPNGTTRERFEPIR